MSAEREPYAEQATADPAAMHNVTPEIEAAAEGVFAYARDRLRARPRDFATARTPEQMHAAAGDTVTEDGIGAEAARAAARGRTRRPPPRPARSRA